MSDLDVVICSNYTILMPKLAVVYTSLLAYLSIFIIIFCSLICLAIKMGIFDEIDEFIDKCELEFEYKGYSTYFQYFFRKFNKKKR